MKANQFAKEEQAQVGIGTMIVFIATVLVAAVAAGVLINVSGDLQSKATATGKATTAQVASHLQVLSVYGIDDTSAVDTTTGGTGPAGGDDDEADQLEIYVQLAAGGKPIDLSKLRVYVDSGDAVTGYEMLPAADADNLQNANYFSLSESRNGDTTNVMDGNDLYKIVIQGTNAAADGVAEDFTGGRLDIGSDTGIKLQFSIAEGNPVSIDFRTPPTIDDDYERLF